MITFEDFKTVLTHKVYGDSCIEIEFRVNGLAEYSYCWMGKMPDTDNPSKNAYWFGLVPDGSKSYDYDTFDAFSSALVFDGQSLEDVWDKVELLSVDSCDPEERIRYLLS